MKNVVVVGFSDDLTRETILALQNDQVICIKEWLGIDNGEGIITFDYRQLMEPETLKKYYEICDEEVYKKIYEELYLFIDMFARNGGWPVYEAVNIFNMWVNFYYAMFKQSKIELVIFQDVSHFGVDSIAKSVADAMEIKIVMLLPINEANKFFAFTKLDDIGSFNTCANDNHSFNVTIEKKYDKFLFYMENIPEEKTGDINYDDLISSFHDLSIIRKEKLKDKDGDAILKLTFDTFQKLRKSYCEKRYEINYEKVAHENVDLNNKYVYFPLQLQPEQTTSAFGGIYSDQLLAIERVRKLIPDDWKIYIKENPCQTYYMRETNFFRRLSLIPNTVFVKRCYATYELIKNSQFVATITGTAGWEAISGGKNVLVFGLAWYRCLPGVFEYNEHVSLEAILEYKINHKELEDEYNKLMRRAYDGVVCPGYEVIVQDFSAKENNRIVTASLKKILESL